MQVFLKIKTCHPYNCQCKLNSWLFFFFFFNENFSKILKYKLVGWELVLKPHFLNDVTANVLVYLHPEHIYNRYT